MADLESVQCCSRGCEAFQGKGKNIRRFWEYVGAAIAIMFILFLFGSCLGCSACFECAAICDDNCGCDLEDCGREVYQQVGCGNCDNNPSDYYGGCDLNDCRDACDNCVRNEGITCGNTENYGACVGFGDCSGCKGQKFYRVTIIVGDEVYTEKLYHTTDKLPIYYPSGASSEYFEFVGYYTKANQKGTRYVNTEGEYVGDLQAKDGLKLYAAYNELGVGQNYTFAFDTSYVPSGVSFVTPTPIPVTVGAEVKDFPVPQEIEGYTFKGWYTYDNHCVTDADGYYKSDAFHLYDVGVNPNEDTQTIVLYAKYEKRSYPIQVVEVRDGIAYQTEAVNVYYGEYLGSHISSTINTLKGDGTTYKYLGLSWEMNPNIYDSTKLFDFNTLYSRVVEDEMQIYVIKRTVVNITLHCHGSEYDDIIYKSYHGEKLNLNDIVEPTTGRKIGELVLEDDFNKGYDFDGWCNKEGASTWDDTFTEITVNKTARSEYYTRNKQAVYTITYRGVNGNILNLPGDNTYKYQLITPLYDLGDDDYYGTFVGWSEYPNGSNPITVIDAYTLYGDKVFYAVYRR